MPVSLAADRPGVYQLCRSVLRVCEGRCRSDAVDGAQPVAGTAAASAGRRAPNGGY